TYNVTTTTYVSGNNTAAYPLNIDDTLNLFDGAALVAQGPGDSPGVQVAGNNILKIDGDVFSLQGNGISGLGGSHEITVGVTGSTASPVMPCCSAGRSQIPASSTASAGLPSTPAPTR